MTTTEYRREYYQKNKQRIQAAAKKWREENPEKVAESRKKYFSKIKKTTTSQRKHAIEDLEAKFGLRPNCCNPGCGKPAFNNGHRWTMFCSHCRLVSQGRKEPKPDITYLRQFTCANADGRADLGFPCFTNWPLVKKHKHKITTHMDHIDGNHLNNDPGNLMELCPYCHDEKGRLNGDKNGWKNKKHLVKKLDS